MMSGLGLVLGMLSLWGINPESQYNDLVVGEYGQTELCALSDRVWSIDARRIDDGIYACDVHSVSEDAGVIVVSTHSCHRGGRDVSARTYRFEILTGATIRAANGEDQSLLRRCQ